MRKLFCLIFLIISSSAYALPDKSTLDKALKRSFKDGHVGVYIKNINTDETYGYNDRHYFVPASTLKILTTLMGFEVLGASYQFTTTLYQKGQDLYLVFTGDPLLTHDQLIQMLQLVPTSPKPYRVHVVEDGLPFDPIPPGWAVEDTRFWYGAPIQALTVNGNLYKTKLVQVNGALQLQDTSPAFGYTLHHNLTLSNNPNHMPDRRDQSHGSLLIGPIANKKLPLKLTFPLQDKKSFGAGLLTHIMAEAGVPLEGAILFDERVPADAIQIQQITSAPLSDIMVQMMHDSDNMMAELIYVKSILKIYPNLQNWDEASDLRVPFFKQAFGVDLTGSKLLDGSGLTRAGLISPHQMGDLLEAAQNKSYYPLFLKTLKSPRWSQNLSFVNAKTGTMGRINCLAGQFTDATGHTHVFAVFINNDSSKEVSVYKNLEGFLHLAAGHKIIPPCQQGS